MNEYDDEQDGGIPELRALPRTIAPGMEIEDAVVAALGARGILRARRRRQTWLAAAALFIAFAGGIWIGRGTAPSVGDPAALSSTVESMPAEVEPGTTVTWF